MTSIPEPSAPPPAFQPPAPELPPFEDVPPHLANQPMQAAIPRPIEAAAVHFRSHDRCLAAMVVGVNAEDPMSPVFTLDLVVFVPAKATRKADRFTDLNRLPGIVRWANNVSHALPDPHDPERVWPSTTWHYAGRDCLPEVVLRGAEQG